MVDSLVSAGYVARVPDPDDRRKMNVSLTDRGRAAAEVIRTAIEDIDAELEQLVGPRDVHRARRVLGVLAALRYDEDPSAELA
jgi:DNA-binding MarR family transcriptional regulator